MVLAAVRFNKHVGSSLCPVSGQTVLQPHSCQTALKEGCLVLVSGSGMKAEKGGRVC